MKNNYIIIIGICVIVVLLASCAKKQNLAEDQNLENSQDQETGKEETAVFAGGCFWCVESDFEKLDGVIEVVSGYAGGTGENPTYEDYGEKGHTEVVEITYDPDKISYESLLEHFWTHIDPLDKEGQFCDKGHEYISAIFYKNKEEKEIAEDSKKRVSKILGEDIATEIIEFKKFWKAEEYHQDYYKKHSIKYNTYRKLCGRDNRVKELWQGKNLSLGQVESWKTYEKPSDEKLKEMLTPIQYKVTQKDGTEKPFDNKYWDNHEEGIYVDLLSGEPLFSSTDKFDSGTGWPSFYKPLEPENIVKKKDFKLIIPRTEIRSKHADSHLGHIILDGPEWNDKIRYCMNSAALRFVPKVDLEREGYGEYLSLFEI